MRSKLFFAAVLLFALTAPAFPADTTSYLDANGGLQRVDQSHGLPVIATSSSAPSPITYTSVTGSPFTLVPNTWTKVATVTASTRALLIAPIASSTSYLVQWTSVPAGAAAPTDTYGFPILAGENFLTGPPLGDVWIMSPNPDVVLVKVGN